MAHCGPGEEGWMVGWALIQLPAEAAQAQLLGVALHGVRPVLVVGSAQL